VIFLLIGIALVATTSVLKWANIGKLKEISGLQNILDLTSIDAITIALICIGAFIILISFIGLMGVCCSNRVFLVIYEIIVIILFLSHLAALITLLVMSKTVENEYRKALNQTVADINSPSTSVPDRELKCSIMANLSGIFQCCGANNQNDFANSSLSSKCCRPEYVAAKGCADLSVDAIKKYSIYLLIIPTAVILFIELISIIGVPFLIASISRKLRA
jgi:hypothetical protein